MPTVMEVSLPPELLYDDQMALWEAVAERFVPFITTRTGIPVSFTVTNAETGTPLPALTDADATSFAQFPLPENMQGEVTLRVVAERPVSVSGLRLALDAHVALPRTVGVSAVVGERSEILLAPILPGGSAVAFPRTTAQEFIVTLTYAQPLRITELRLVEGDAADAEVHTRTLRYLAQPGASYHLYSGADRPVHISVGERGDLAGAENIRRQVLKEGRQNDAYVPADLDSDGVVDTLDNCVQRYNPDQADSDNNGRGDVCEDYDRDGHEEAIDNCPTEPNRDQRDTDSDGIGDACDPEESRFTEQNAWIPWVGMGFAALVLVMVLVIALRSEPQRVGDE